MTIPPAALAEVKDSDALLIAAAPELPHALKCLVDKYTWVAQSGDYGLNPELDVEVIVARQVIAKAEGR